MTIEELRAMGYKATIFVRTEAATANGMPPYEVYLQHDTKYLSNKGRGNTLEDALAKALPDELVRAQNDPLR